MIFKNETIIPNRNTNLRAVRRSAADGLTDFPIIAWRITKDGNIPILAGGLQVDGSDDWAIVDIEPDEAHFHPLKPGSFPCTAEEFKKA
ncbi:hypothetical protein ACP26O_18075 [Burkholderia sp. R-40]|uniref:hypothetical protein n=1 Tax=Burkholderia sp. R-40 TaxID=3416709 RepID=UPI003CF73324